MKTNRWEQVQSDRGVAVIGRHTGILRVFACLVRYRRQKLRISGKKLFTATGIPGHCGD
ncbi:MAG: hypothetical protein R3C59_30605 [Planctomycetaceae bacterium]